jgi:hypothetical protein
LSSGRDPLIFSVDKITNFAATDNNSQIGIHHQRAAQGSTPTSPLHRFDRTKMDLLGGLVSVADGINFV